MLFSPKRNGKAGAIKEPKTTNASRSPSPLKYFPKDAVKIEKSPIRNSSIMKKPISPPKSPSAFARHIA